MNVREDFVFFWSGPFSQWHQARFELDGREFTCAEQYMMFCKARLFGDQETAKKILASRSAREQKTLGRQVQNFDEGTWRIFREGIVFSGNLAKFTQNDDLRQQMIATGSRTLVEASPKDTVWGIGLAEDDPRILDRSKWRGTNLLGEILMQVRSCLNQCSIA
jgi:ribA/ribD-fused uncharacterized protein